MKQYPSAEQLPSCRTFGSWVGLADAKARKEENAWSFIVDRCRGRRCDKELKRCATGVRCLIGWIGFLALSASRFCETNDLFRTHWLAKVNMTVAQRMIEAVAL